MMKFDPTVSSSWGQQEDCVSLPTVLDLSMVTPYKAQTPFLQTFAKKLDLQQKQSYSNHFQQTFEL